MPEGKIRIDQALTDVSVGYKNGEYVADRVLPVVPVDHKSDKYYVHGKDLFRVRDDRRSPGGEARKSRWTLSNSPYFCEGHALKDFVAREDQSDADPQLDLLMDTTEVLTDQILLNQEVSLVTLLAAGMTGSSVVDLAAIKWNNDANDPVKKIKEQALVIGKRTGKRPNVLTLSAPVFDAISENAKVTARITGAADLPSAKVTPQQLASLLMIDEVIVASAIKDTANEGQTAVTDWVWGAYGLLQYRPRNPGRKTLSLGYTFHWTKAFQNADGEAAGAQFVKRYYWEPNTADVVEVHKYYDQVLVATDAGVLFTNAI